MTKIKVFFLIIAVGLVCCTKPNSNAIESQKIQGRYEIDLAELVQNELDGEADAVKAMASFFLSQMHMSFQFTEDQLIMDASESLRGLVNAFGEGDKMPVVMRYEIKNDSVLYVTHDDGRVDEVGVIRKVGGTYDYLQLVCPPDGEEAQPTVLTFRKQTEPEGEKNL